MFHRVIPGFMIQGGDPTGSARAARLRLPDELEATEHASISRASLAYGQPGPDTNGSQFFITEVATPPPQPGKYDRARPACAATPLRRGRLRLRARREDCAPGNDKTTLVKVVISKTSPAASKPLSKTAEAMTDMAEQLFATFNTSAGDIVVKLFPEKAPKTVENFLGPRQGTKEWTDPDTGQK